MRYFFPLVLVVLDVALLFVCIAKFVDRRK
jgi:hypothetical protein